MPYNATYFVTLSMIVLAAMAISSPLAKLLHLPRGLLLIAIGFAGSELLGGRGIDIGIHRDDFRELILYLFLPALIFEAALRMNISKFIENITSILMLAIPLSLLAVLLASAVMYLAMDTPQTFPWIAALLAGALIAPTDSTAIGSVERYRCLPERIRVIVEGESLLNNVVILVLFFITLGIALETIPGTATDFFYGTTAFNLLLVFLGGGALGVLVAIPGCILLGKLRDINVQAAVTLLCAYGAYTLADTRVVDVSGIVAVMICGIIISSSTHKGDQEKHESDLDKIWSFIGGSFESAIYLLAGITMTAALFTEQWLAMLIGIVVAAVSRAIMIYGSFPLFNLGKYKDQPIGSSEQHIVALGGVRGVLTMALALSLPMELGYWSTLQAIAYGVVIFTLLVQAGALAALARKLPQSASQRGEGN